MRSILENFDFLRNHLLKKDKNRLNSFIRHSTIVIRHSNRQPAGKLNPSGFAFKADRYVFSLDNDWNLSYTFGIPQHGFQLIRLFDNVAIVKLPAAFGKCFTSCPGMRSGIFSIDQNLVRHPRSSTGV